MKKQPNPTNVMYGELVEVASLTGDKDKPYNFDCGYHSGMKIHFFNKKGVLLGNLYEFVPYDRIRFRSDSHVWERHYMEVVELGTGKLKRRAESAEWIRQSLYELQCRIITYLIRKTQFI